MKERIVYRIYGAAEASVFGWFAKVYGISEFVSNPNLFLDAPLGSQAFYGVNGALLAFGVADGLSGVIAGMPHYLCLKTWKYFSRSEKGREKIDKETDRIHEKVERRLF